MKYSIKQQIATIFIAVMAGTIILCWFINNTFLENFYINNFILLVMILTVEELKNFIDNLPGDYCIEYHDKDGISHPINDTLEVDLSGEKLILKSQ